LPLQCSAKRRTHSWPLRPHHSYAGKTECGRTRALWRGERTQFIQLGASCAQETTNRFRYLLSQNARSISQYKSATEEMVKLLKLMPVQPIAAIGTITDEICSSGCGQDSRTALGSSARLGPDPRPTSAEARKPTASELWHGAGTNFLHPSRASAAREPQRCELAFERENEIHR
jgi:hypothetical protein